ncbi:MAG: UDP-N-acetylglucosamine 1-carboxyvinyltransferase [Marmoricola sp.]
MSSFRVHSQGPFTAPLSGAVEVGGAKNSALKLMAATLLAPGRSTIRNVPDILDVTVMGQLLEQLGCRVSIAPEESGDFAAAKPSLTVIVEVPAQLGHEAPYELVRRLRASISVLGPLVARCHRASVALPGGDAIGSRGLNMHMSGLDEMGARCHVEHGQVIAKVDHELRGARLGLDFPSVGATENLLMAAVLAKGTTSIDNAAREPEIADLCSMLTKMGAQIEGATTSTLLIEGVESLQPVDHTTVTDRIVAGTWAFAAALAGGRVRVVNGIAEHLDLPLDKLQLAGGEIDTDAAGFSVSFTNRPRAIEISTLPYPGFPTDLQPFAMALASVSEGMGMITENVFESRFMFAQELARLGADVRVDGHHASIHGGLALSGAPVEAHDIRAGAALVLAGLAAVGTTTVSQSHHIDRGYPAFAEHLRSLGAEVERI